MRVTISRTDGSLEEMDTDRLTRPEPFPGKALMADFTLRWGSDRSLLLDADFYDVGDVPEGEVARRRRGWSLLLSSESEFGTVASVSVDGGLAWVRVGGGLLDVRRLQAATSLWYEGDGRSMASRAAWLHDLLADAGDPRSAEARALEAVGLSAEAYEEVARVAADIL